MGSLDHAISLNLHIHLLQFEWENYINWMHLWFSAQTSHASFKWFCCFRTLFWRCGENAPGGCQRMGSQCCKAHYKDRSIPHIIQIVVERLKVVNLKTPYIYHRREAFKCSKIHMWIWPELDLHLAIYLVPHSNCSWKAQQRLQLGTAVHKVHN